MKWLIAGFMVLGLALLYLLSTASANSALFAQTYPMLLAVNGGFVSLLAGLVLWQFLRLRRRSRQGVFGTKLTLRLLRMFALMAVVPGMIVYLVSVVFLARSIDTWFDVRVERALDAGLNLGRSALDAQLADLSKKAEGMAREISEQRGGTPVALLNALSDQHDVHEAALFDQKGSVLAYNGSERSGLVPLLPSQAQLRQVRAQQTLAAVEPLEERGLYLRVLVPVNVLTASDAVWALQLLQPVSRQLTLDAEAVEAVRAEYQGLALSRVGLKRLYAVTLTLTVVLAVLAALLLAVFLSRRLSAPLGVLAEGTRAVAQGDYSPRLAVTSPDELGVLTQSFNDMTHQLEEAREEARARHEDLTAAHAYLTSVLAHLSAGVLAFDAGLALQRFNPGAATILLADLDPVLGVPLDQWAAREPALAAFSAALGRELARGAAEWSTQVELGRDGVTQTLLVRGSRLASGAEPGQVVVFDDITRLIQAQRDAAWGEVARRLAHEIKNPLTPIQLSAERLQHKLASRLGESDAAVLHRSTQTIVNQVAALKSMVDAFSQYARSPKPELAPVDLNTLVREVAGLYESSRARMSLDLDPALPAAAADPVLLRQVIHNLLKNAEEALSAAEQPAITVATRADPRGVRLMVTDNGSGFPEDLIARVFEPYVTTKPKGTGLGLAVVKKIVDEHQGQLQVRNLGGGGAQVAVTLPAAAASLGATATA